MRTVLSFDDLLSKTGSFKRLFEITRMQGLNLEEEARKILSAESPLFSAAKFSIIEIRDGFAELSFPYGELIGRRGGLVHGGIISYALDNAGGIAVMTENEGIDQLTLELKINFLRPLKHSPYRVLGSVLRSGRKISVAQAEIKDSEGELCAKALGTWFKIYADEKANT